MNNIKKIFLKVFLIVIVIFVTISLFQMIGVIPKRCDDLGPGFYKNPDGTATIISPSGKHCYGIWELFFWIRPLYM